ncbi:MAG: ABC transporter substrate-binding protein [Brachymonas sp.]|nr:ABC transporter substrate-binding protein [Brachymonas sp.]
MKIAELSTSSFIRLSVLAGSIVCGLAACTQQAATPKQDAASPAASQQVAASATPEQAAGGKRLVLAIKGEPEQGFDPVKGWGRYGNPLFQSTLLKRTEKLDIVGDLATDWKLSEDGKTWTITIREGVKFADGQPLTADDVVFTYEQGKQSAGVLDLTELEGAKALSPTTVEITLKQPHITFVNSLASIGIVPRHAYKDDYAQNPMGSGPFRFVNWTKGQQLVIEPNPHYYGNKPAFERITFLYTSEDATAAAARAGQVHMAVVTPATAGNVPEKMNRLVVDSVDNRGIMFPMVPAGQKTKDGKAVGNDVTADPAIRRAINIGINRKQLTEGVLGGYGTPAWGVADNLPWDNPEQRLPDGDVEGAKALLDKAGWKPGADGIRVKNGKPARFTMIYPAGDNVRQSLAVAVADMFKPLGIQADLGGKSWDEIYREQHASAVLFGWGSHDPVEVYRLYNAKFAGVEAYNAGFYNNETVARHLEAAQAANTPEASLPHWKNALWDGTTGAGMKGDAAWAWLVNLQHIYFVDKCLDIGPRQIEPHGHGYPVTWNMQDWKWTCQ